MITRIACFVVLGFATPAAAEDFGNKSVVALTRAGVGADVLRAKIASLPCSYDVSTDSILELKAAGVPDAVIAAMVDRCAGSAKAQGAVAATSDPAAIRTPGLYIDQGASGAHKLEKIRPTLASGGRASGNGSVLFPFRMKLAIASGTARTAAASSRPTFYFYFPADDVEEGDFGTAKTYAAQSPSEFNLVKFSDKNGQREMSIAKQTPFRGSVGVDAKDAIQFSSAQVADGTFSATPNKPLAPGEYGFVWRAATDAYRIYDFSVRQ